MFIKLAMYILHTRVQPQCPHIYFDSNTQMYHESYETATLFIYN